MKVLCGLLAAACLALVVTVSASGAARIGHCRTRRRRRPGAIPICRASGPAPTWSACRSSGRRSSATGCSSPMRSSRRARRRPRSRPQLDVLDFDLEKPPAEIVALGDVGGVTSPPPHWLERGLPSRQSSLIVDPPDGKMPPMTPEGKARQKTARRHVHEADRIQQRRRARSVRSLHLARRRRVDDAGRLQQRQPDHPGARATWRSATR